jgi:predicted rRNA methylase YqxC with S4 and FtsJ domains
MQRFLLFFDKRFEKSAEREVEQKFNGIVLEKLGRVDAVELAMATVDASSEEIGNWMKNDVRFIESAILLLGSLERVGTDIDYEKVVELMAGLLLGKEPFMLEALNFGLHTGAKAKEIEIEVGSRLEKLGFVCDLAKPEHVYYLIVTKNIVFIGTECSGWAKRLSIDSFRHANKTVKNAVSRAEFKLAEAFDFFDVDIERIKMVADIGAAPGGWTAFLLSKGAKVIAIDSANLDIAGIEKRIGRSVKVVEDVEVPESKFDILYIKSLAQNVSESLFKRKGMLDALVIDVNFDIKTTASLAMKYSSMLKKGACLVATFKLRSPKEIKDIAVAEKIINGDYEKVRIRKLPHNRSEITCFAVKR